MVRVWVLWFIVFGSCFGGRWCVVCGLVGCWVGGGGCDFFVVVV